MPSKDSSVDWVQYYVDDAKNDGEKKLRHIEATVVQHDLTFTSLAITTLRVILAWVGYFFVTLQVFGSPNKLNLNNGAIILGAILYFSTLALGVVAGQTSTPSFEMCIMLPLWTWMRARKGHKMFFLWRAAWVSVLELAVGLALAFAMQRAVSAINPNVLLQIPANITVPTTTYASVLLFCSFMGCTIMFFDILGIGEKDGVWLSRAPADTNLKRTMADRHFEAVVATGKFLFLYAVTGQAYPVDPFYVWATWTQDTPSSGTDYNFIFTWLLVTPVVTSAVLTCMAVFNSDLALAVFGSLGRWRSRRRRRAAYSKPWWKGFSSRGGRKYDDDNDEDEDEDKEENSDSDDE